MLEAERQKATVKRVDDWADEFSKLMEDDAFTTFIQVLDLTKPYDIDKCCTSLKGVISWFQEF